MNEKDNKSKLTEWLWKAMGIFLMGVITSMIYSGKEMNSQTPETGKEYRYICQWEEVPNSEAESRISSIIRDYGSFEELTFDNRIIYYRAVAGKRELGNGHGKKKSDYQKEFHLLAYEKSDDPIVKVLHLIARGTDKLKDQRQVLQDIYSKDCSVYADPMPLPEDVTNYIANAFGGVNDSKLTVSKETADGNYVFLSMNADQKEWKVDEEKSAIYHETSDWAVGVTMTGKIKWDNFLVGFLPDMVAQLYSFDGDMRINGNAIHYTCEGGLTSSVNFKQFSGSKYMRCMVINAETKVGDVPVNLVFSAKFKGEPSKEEVENLIAECFHNMDIQLMTSERTQFEGGKTGIVLDNEEWMAEAQEFSIVDDNLVCIFRIENRTDEVKIARVDDPIVNKYRLSSLVAEDQKLQPGEQKTVMIKIPLETLKDYHLDNIESITVPVMLDRRLQRHQGIVEKYCIFYNIYSASDEDTNIGLTGEAGSSQKVTGTLDKLFSGKPIFKEETEEYYFAYELIDVKDDPEIGCRIRYYVKNKSDSRLNYKITREYINDLEYSLFLNSYTFAGRGSIGDIDIQQFFFDNNKMTFDDIESVVLKYAFY